MKKYNVAVVGATGNVGREILNILDERNFPVKKLYAIASERSKGKEIKFGKDKSIKVDSLTKFNFNKAEIVLSSPGAAISKNFVPKAVKSGAIVIDNTSFFRMDKNIPLIVPEVNLDDLKKYKKSNIIANPNCSTIQLVVALKPIHEKYTIKRIVVSTYQSTSGAGKSAMDELFNQTLDIFKNKPLKMIKFSKKIAFNVIPHIDDFLDDGQTKEEMKIVEETKKILDSKIKVTATCVRVPVFIGHGESVNIETKKSIDSESVKELLNDSKGISVIDARVDGGYVSSDECAGKDEVFVSRIRDDQSVKNGISLWVVADNLRKGAALNTIQIAEEIIKSEQK